MPNEPQISGLSRRHRLFIFWLLVVVFLVTLPVLIFYTTGYRISFSEEEATIVTTGGMYVTTDDLGVDVYVDDEQVERPRLFRSAYYIQNIAAGQHRIVVQQEGLETWVKELPVYPYIVTEVAAFNMPRTPQVRPITPYVTTAGTPIVVGTSSVSLPGGATSSVPILAATSTATSSLVRNEEQRFVASLFTATSSPLRSVFQADQATTSRFQFATSTTPRATSTLTTTEERIESGGMELIRRAGEVYAVWQEDRDRIPYYFCVNEGAGTSTVASRYGEHVAVAVARYARSTSSPLTKEGSRWCRPEIKLDRQRQDVYFYDFYPDRNDLVLLHLTDGLYVTEIDDRAWQNSQLLYAGTDFRVVVENETIYLYDDGQYYELLTEIVE